MMNRPIEQAYSGDTGSTPGIQSGRSNNVDILREILLPDANKRKMGKRERDNLTYKQAAERAAKSCVGSEGGDYIGRTLKERREAGTQRHDRLRQIDNDAKHMQEYLEDIRLGFEDLRSSFSPEAQKLFLEDLNTIVEDQRIAIKDRPKHRPVLEGRYNPFSRITDAHRDNRENDYARETIVKFWRLLKRYQGLLEDYERWQSTQIE